MTKVKIQAWVPTAEDEEAFRAGDATFQWLCNLSAESLRLYAGKWIAAQDCKVIAAADSYDALLDELGDRDLRSVIIDRIEQPGWTIYR